MERLVEHELGKTAAALSMDQIPELKLVRDRALNEAEAIIGSRRPEWKPGEFEPVILPSDPITAAERVLKTAEKFGPDSHQYEQAYKAALTDNHRALAEAYRKATWEYFPPLEHHYDGTNGIYTAFGRPLIEIAYEGLRWDEHAEERRRLANEYAEEIGYHEFGGHEQSDTHWVLTISPCPDHAIENPDKGYGYVPGIEKMMVRGVHFLSNKKAGLHMRALEQAAVPGTLLDKDIVLRTLHTLGAMDSMRDISKTELHGMQFLIDKNEVRGVLDIVEIMDETAGEGVFMGEYKPGLERDYSSIKQTAKNRQRLLETQARELTEYMIDLARHGTNHVWAAKQIEQKINDAVHYSAKTDPRIAREAFDEKTARGYEQAIMLDRQGKHKRASGLRHKTQSKAPTAAYCGAGSCGLRYARGSEKSLGRSLGLLGEILTDMERSCPRGHKGILYGSNGKGCGICRRTEINKRTKTTKSKQHVKKTGKKPNGFWS